MFIGGVSQVATGLPQLVKSSNGAINFVRVGAGLPADASIATITVDPLNPNVVYVGNYGNGTVNQASLFRSSNGGANFVPNLNLFGKGGSRIPPAFNPGRRAPYLASEDDADTADVAQDDADAADVAVQIAVTAVPADLAADHGFQAGFCVDDLDTARDGGCRLTGIRICKPEVGAQQGGDDQRGASDTGFHGDSLCKDDWGSATRRRIVGAAGRIIARNET